MTVVVLGGGLAGVACAHTLGRRGRRAWCWSTATTTTSSSRCSTRWPPRSCPRRTSPARTGRSSATTPPSRSSRRTSTRARWPTARLGLDRRADPHRDPPGDGRGAPPELLRRPRGGRARLPALLGRRRRTAAAPPPGASSRRPATGPAQDDGTLDVVVVGGGPTGVETTGALAELMHARWQSTGRTPTRADHAGRPRHGPARRVLREVPRLRPQEADQARADGQARDRRRLRAPRPGRVRRRHAASGPGPWSGVVGSPASAIAAERRTCPPAAADASTSSRTSPSRASPACTPSATSPTSPTPTGDDAPPARLGRPAVRAPGLRRTSSASCAESRTKPFHYKDKGIMAMIGRNAAVAEVGQAPPRGRGPDRVRRLARRPRHPAERRAQQDRRLPHLGMGLLRPRPRRHRRGLRDAEAHRLGRPRGRRPPHLARRPTSPPATTSGF